MQRIFSRRSALPVVLSLLILVLITSAGLAGSKLIQTERGGTVPVGKGAVLHIPANALTDDAWIEAQYIEDSEALIFEFTIDGADDAFDPPLTLKVPASIAKKASSDLLYGEDGDVIAPTGTGHYELEHFSRYYFERR